MSEDAKPGASDPKIEGVRPASTREAVHGVKQQGKPSAGSAGETGRQGSFESVVLGPDLGPSPKADPDAAVVVPRSVVPSGTAAAPQGSGERRAAPREPAASPAPAASTAPGGQAAPVRPKPVTPQARAGRSSGESARAEAFADQVTDKGTPPPAGAAPEAGRRGAAFHDAPTNLGPAEGDVEAVGAALTGFGELPADFAARTLIASADPRPVAQPARDRVQISAREVAAELEDPRLIMLRQPDSERAATFRILRHRLVERGHPRTILVTSPRPGDGKTLLAANLALALSECGRARVLLVEANLRRPHLAKLLGFRPPSCFAAQLASHKTNPMDPWMVAQVYSPWLHVAAIDYTTFEQPRVIDGPALEGGLDQLKRVQYDYLVLDTPPVLGHADVNLVQDAADAVLFAAWARRTSTKDLQRAIDQLTPSKVLGVALLEV